MHTSAAADGIFGAIIDTGPVACGRADSVASAVSEVGEPYPYNKSAAIAASGIAVAVA
ncbi:hypothetical protein Afe04nite_21600 [Asanoa ferruginea]|nr:hypothetical protein Afe04nite_21600 [Asanoa ferruginea]